MSNLSFAECVIKEEDFDLNNDNSEDAVEESTGTGIMYASLQPAMVETYSLLPHTITAITRV